MLVSNQLYFSAFVLLITRNFLTLYDSSLCNAGLTGGSWCGHGTMQDDVFSSSQFKDHLRR